MGKLYADIKTDKIYQVSEKLTDVIGTNLDYLIDNPRKAIEIKDESIFKRIIEI